MMTRIYQQALAHIRNDDWDAAHRLIQDYSDPLSCRIHGYLHRVEGDFGNAGYWYRRMGMVMPDNTLAEELALLCSIAQSVQAADDE